MGKIFTLLCNTLPITLSFLLAGCIVPKESVPTGMYPKVFPKVPEPDASAVSVPSGYKAEVFMKDLIWPTSMEFDDKGNFYVAEAGYVYGDPFAPAQVLKISSGGDITRLADQLMGPVTDLLWYKDRLYVSQRGKISVIEADGQVKDLVTGLPSYGDHHNNQMSAGPDGKIYFGQGTATNSGVVGVDNVYPYVWLMLWPDVHDVPAKDIRLRHPFYITPQPNHVLSRQGNLISLGKAFVFAVASVFNRNKDKSMLVKTKAFQPFGFHKSRVEGEVKASGTILSMNTDGTGLSVYAWGLRNPFGVMWGPDGKLYASDNGYDERGSRPIAHAKDNVFQIQKDGWYGFPDYSSGIPVTDRQFKAERGKRPKFLLKDHPEVASTWLTRPEHAGVAKFDFSTSASFGYQGQMFLTEVGTSAPASTNDTTPNGYVLVRIDPKTKQAVPFMSNKKPGPQGLEYVATAGPRRPVEAKFSPDGNTLYVVDIGVIGFELAGAGPFPMPVPGTGVIWKITKDDVGKAGALNNLSVMPPKANAKKK
jgi:glucose/arabinose dehydrogenase